MLVMHSSYLYYMIIITLPPSQQKLIHDHLVKSI